MRNGMAIKCLGKLGARLYMMVEMARQIKPLPTKSEPVIDIKTLVFKPLEKGMRGWWLWRHCDFMAMPPEVLFQFVLIESGKVFRVGDDSFVDDELLEGGTFAGPIL